MMQSFCRCYDKFFCCFKWLQSPIFLLLRLYFGYKFMVAGYGKLGNLDGTAQYFGTIGIFLPWAQALAVGLIEFLGGIMLMIGLASRLAGLLLTFVMLGAYFFAHWDAVTAFTSYPVLQAAENFMAQHPFMYMLVSLLVVMFGPGCLSVDKFLHKKCDSDSCAC